MSRMKHFTVYRKLLRDLMPHYEIKLRKRRDCSSGPECEDLYKSYLSKASELFGTQIESLGFKAHDVAIALGSIC